MTSHPQPGTIRLEHSAPRLHVMDIPVDDLLKLLRRGAQITRCMQASLDNAKQLATEARIGGVARELIEWIEGA